MKLEKGCYKTGMTGMKEPCRHSVCVCVLPMCFFLLHVLHLANCVSAFAGLVYFRTPPLNEKSLELL